VGTLAEIQTVTAGNELHVCPNCGYNRGFHTSFIRENTGKDEPVKPTPRRYHVILICPECGARYDVGWTCTLAEPDGASTGAHAAGNPLIPSGPGNL